MGEVVFTTGDVYGGVWWMRSGAARHWDKLSSGGRIGRCFSGDYPCDAGRGFV